MRYDDFMRRVFVAIGALSLFAAGATASPNEAGTPGPAGFEATCGPLPKESPDDGGEGAPTLCPPANLSWSIPGQLDTEGKEAICYGRVRVSLLGETVKRCGRFHCQTLRFCDGTEMPRHCSLQATCVNGKAVATGFGW